MYSLRKIRLRRDAPMAPKRKSQPRINASLFPEVERLIELVGKVIGVPGTEWGTGSGRVSAAEKATIFKCVLRDHTCVYKFPNALSSEKAWQLQEMSVSGRGSLEHGNSSGDICWLPNQTFLKYYFQFFLNTTKFLTCFTGC